MTFTDLSARIKARVYPFLYSYDVLPSGTFDFMMIKGAPLPTGKYAFGLRQLTGPLSYSQYKIIREEARILTKSMWLIREVGLYLILCGPRNFWELQTNTISADKTGFHRIIINAVHFIDPETQATHLSKSSWGPAVFGDVRLLSNIVEEEFKKNPQQGVAPYVAQGAPSGER